MAISEEKMRIVIDNYFKTECDVNTSIRQAFEKGFRIGVKKGLSAQPDRKKGKWLTNEEIVRPTRFIEWHCSSCGKGMEAMGSLGFNFCPNCGSYNGGDNE